MSERLRFGTKYWEGVYTADFTLDQVRRRCYQVGLLLQQRNWSCLIAYDTRFMSGLFARDMYHILTHQGIAASLVSDPVPMPAVQSALNQQQCDCALIVSAGNRPYWYNGLVLLGTFDDDFPLQTSDYASPPLSFPLFPDTAGNNQMLKPEIAQDLRAPYIDLLRKQIDVNLIRRSTMTIFADPMNGTTAGYFPAIMGEGGQTRAIEINRETDPLFSKLTPLPVESNLTRLRKLVRESDSHLGLAFSADGSALGVVDKNGEQLEHLEIVLLLAAYLVRQYRQSGAVIAPVPVEGSRLAGSLAGLGAWETALGLKVELSPDPSRRIAEVLMQTRDALLIGCTGEGELVLGQYAPYPDALFAGLLMAELVARNGGNLHALLSELRGRLKTHQ